MIAIRPHRPHRRRAAAAAAPATAALIAAALIAAAAPPAAAQRADAAYTVHKVQRGDTLELLAAEYYGDRRHKIYIMIENRLDHARELKPGEKLRIPISNEVTVSVGDTLASLAAQYLGDERRAKYLAEFNGLDPDGSVAAGMSITIPLRVTYRAAGDESLAAIASALFADDRKAALLKAYNFLQRDRLARGDTIVVPIYLRVQPSKRRPPDAESAALIAKRTEMLEAARRVLPDARAAWKAGDYAAVKRGLAELVATLPYLDTELVVEIGVLLGSAYVAFGDLDTARATFEQVLARKPKHALSAYQHSPKVREVWRKAGGAVDESAR
ncbi:MAG TPA: LysM peptidoglycan-binding domain-containing protein [Kofleriaceae bacterium]|nr:LysM peptidoglycan-binding domain-containing protein [Kofleriaceae bacterium]